MASNLLSLPKYSRFGKFSRNINLDSRFDVRKTCFKLLSQAAGVNSTQSTQVDFTKSVNDFKRNGMALLPLKIDPDFVEKSKKICFGAWRDALKRAKIIRGHEMKVGMEFGFQEFVARAQGRYDMHWMVNGEKHFLDEENVLSKFMPFVHEILGGEKMTSLTFNGCLFSLAGANEQLWHTDGEHLFSSENQFKCWGKDGNSSETSFFNEDIKGKRVPADILPAHCINVFVPLVDVDATNGATEFCLGSHFHTKFFVDDIVWQDNSWIDRIGFNGDVVTIKVKKGEVLAFDYRVLHRALKHTGEEVRPLLYYTFTKRWFTDAMNFADLPSLHEADEKLLQTEKFNEGEKEIERNNVQRWRNEFPNIVQNKDAIFCDGAAGTQVPNEVMDSMVSHLRNVGSTNVGGEYPTGEQALNTVTAARLAGKDLLGTTSTGEIAFGQNCTNLMFHLARSIENSVNDVKFAMQNQLVANEDNQMNIRPGDNIVLSRACHDANIAPWLQMARNLGLEVRWLDCLGSSQTVCIGSEKTISLDNKVDDGNMDCIDIEQIPNLIDSKTRLISLGLASNATGRIHLSVIEKINKIRDNFNDSQKPFLILDGTHYLPHRKANLTELKADAILCSAYKFFGPHLGVMAFNGSRMKHLMPSKSGLRYDKNGNFDKDILGYGEYPNVENCEISRWEMGTLNYEALIGFESCVNYLASLRNSSLESKSRTTNLEVAFDTLRTHEEELSQRFLNGIRSGLMLNKIRLLGSRDVKERTPTFALTLNNCSNTHEVDLVQKLNENNIYCTHGNHYAPYLVENCLNEPKGVTRISLLHYNTIEEVDKILDVIDKYVS